MLSCNWLTANAEKRRQREERTKKKIMGVRAGSRGENWIGPHTTPRPHQLLHHPGTEKPWVEAHILNEGASLVVTLEVSGAIIWHARAPSSQLQHLRRSIMSPFADPDRTKPTPHPSTAESSRPTPSWYRSSRRSWPAQCSVRTPATSTSW